MREREFRVRVCVDCHHFLLLTHITFLSSFSFRLQQDWQPCDFLSDQQNNNMNHHHRHHHQQQQHGNNIKPSLSSSSAAYYDPFNRDIVGPRSCEYCKTSSTIDCCDQCKRPKLYFSRKEKIFDNGQNNNFHEYNHHHHKK